MTLAADPEVTAVLCRNDEVTIGVARAMAEHGRAIPDEVSLVGFDDQWAGDQGAGDQGGDGSGEDQAGGRLPSTGADGILVAAAAALVLLLGGAAIALRAR